MTQATLSMITLGFPADYRRDARRRRGRGTPRVPPATLVEPPVGPLEKMSVAQIEREVQEVLLKHRLD